MAVRDRAVRVAIVGRPNVGKSTLFNRLIGRRRAITMDTPGITRDAIVERVRWQGRSLELIDTGGLEGEAEIALADEVHAQTVGAIERADLLVVLFDAHAGAGPLDAATVELAQRSGKPVLYVANKADSPSWEAAAVDLCRLGIDLPLAVSAEHGIGLGELRSAILEVAEELASDAAADERAPAAAPAQDDAAEAAASEGAGPGRALRVALVGRPNVGKSSFLNLVAGEKLSLVDDRPGTTRDSIDTEIVRAGRRYMLVDTAGMRRPSRVDRGVEWLSVGRSLEAIDHCDVAVLLIEPSEGMTDQDARIARRAVDEGRAIVLALNKIDLLADRKEAETIGRRLRDFYPTLAHARLSYLSVAEGRGIDACFQAIDEAAAAHNLQIDTPTINRILAGAAERRQPPVIGRGRLRMLYGTQVAVRPPTIRVFVNRQGVPDDYLRFLERCFREELPLEGTPLRLRFSRRDSHGGRDSNRKG
jgi:GTP-binding protein